MSISGDDFSAAVERLRDIAAAKRQIEEQFADAAAEARERHKRITSQRSFALAEYEEEEADLREKVCAYREERGDEYEDVVEGISFRRTHEVVSVDMVKVCQAIAEGRVSADMVQLDARAYLAKLKRLGGLFSVEGVESREAYCAAVTAATKKQEE